MKESRGKSNEENKYSYRGGGYPLLNNGFTLMELLGVIIILAIISVIVIPNVVRIIDESKASTVATSAQNYLRAVEQEIINKNIKENFDPSECVIQSDGNLICDGNMPLTIDAKGRKPSSGTIIIKNKVPVGIKDFVMSGYELDMTEAGEVIVKGSSSSWNPGGSTGGNTGSNSITLEKSSVGSNFIVVQANINNIEIEKIEYSLDDGDSWENGELSTIHTFNGLTKNTSYQIKARITSNGKTITSNVITISTKDITEPTYTTETAGASKIVTINYPKINGQTLTYEYSLDKGSTWKPATQIQNVTFNVNGTLIGRVTDGTNTITASTLTIDDVQLPEEVYLNGAEPQVYSGLVPVKYDGTYWRIVDPKTKWYDYENQEWANAVILKSGALTDVGTIVDIANEVQGMFVWIPRYEYKIEGQYGTHTDGTAGTAELPGEIKVNFISKTTTTPSSTYRIHPAFTFGTTELSGIWVGKFETTGTATAPTILPSNASLINQNVSTQFTTAQIFNTYVNNSSIDAHMSKNSEWGSVAYLSQSKYGKYGNANYTGANKQVMINNCTKYITGVGADSQDEAGSKTTCTTNTYETSKGQAASTTGNITGIYDMSGGTNEYVMGVLLDGNGTPISGKASSVNSGFNGPLYDGGYNGEYTSGKAFPNPKYYNLYASEISTTACSGGICYGHALSETAGWYNDLSSSFVVSYAPWLLRGSSCGAKSNAGVFSFTNYYGSAATDFSFRIVISEN